VSDIKIVEAWLANQQLEQLENYLKRGRPLAGVALRELRSRWIASMRSWAESFRKFDHSEHEDIEAEMSLRKVEPPFDRIKEAMKKIVRQSKEHTDALLQDPTRFRQTKRKIADEIDRFQKTVRGKKH
jgi:hypothetical protein